MTYRMRSPISALLQGCPSSRALQTATAISIRRHSIRQKNKAVLLEASEYALYGDWGYLETDMWINQWQGRLNEAGGVRDGKTTLDDFFAEVTGRTNNALASLYARKIGD